MFTLELTHVVFYICSTFYWDSVRIFKSCADLLVSLMSFLLIFPCINSPSLSADCSEWQDGGVHQHPRHSLSQCCTHAHSPETQRHPTGLPAYSYQFYTLYIRNITLYVFFKTSHWLKFVFHLVLRRITHTNSTKPKATSWPSVKGKTCWGLSGKTLSEYTVTLSGLQLREYGLCSLLFTMLRGFQCTELLITH